MSAPAKAPALGGIVPSAPSELSFDRASHIRAFRLERPHGDILIYGAPHLGEAVAARAPLTRHYLGHGHEAMFLPAAPVAPLFVHEGDAAAVRPPHHVRAAFSRPHRLDDDFEVIPMPGHTPGSAAYLWDSGEHRVLFTADSVYLRDGEWVAALLGSSDRDAYLESLDRLAGLQFDVLVPWLASAGQPWYARTDPADARRRLGAIADRLRRGGDH